MPTNKLIFVSANHCSFATALSTWHCVDAMDACDALISVFAKSQKPTTDCIPMASSQKRLFSALFLQQYFPLTFFPSCHLIRHYNCGVVCIYSTNLYVKQTNFCIKNNVTASPTLSFSLSHFFLRFIFFFFALRILLCKRCSFCSSCVCLFDCVCFCGWLLLIPI